eukprot:TRINITY_DN21255_c0_g1_i1.p1 TRINITY_DN21255_c0_g1~~TRINITY_DN21255_c0_g1_i1.p1  ORF type:complete len:282 (+),score=17.25 TRINITY_DN21255_c0_g1_i1:32-877(+)
MGALASQLRGRPVFCTMTVRILGWMMLFHFARLADKSSAFRNRHNSSRRTTHPYIKEQYLTEDEFIESVATLVQQKQGGYRRVALDKKPEEANHWHKMEGYCLARKDQPPCWCATQFNDFGGRYQASYIFRGTEELSRSCFSRLSCSGTRGAAVGYANSRVAVFQSRLKAFYYKPLERTYYYGTTKEQVKPLLSDGFMVGDENPLGVGIYFSDLQTAKTNAESGSKSEDDQVVIEVEIWTEPEEDERECSVSITKSEDERTVVVYDPLLIFPTRILHHEDW